jgi:hypothetical protein
MNEHEALNWIIDSLESRNIPYIVCGGLAAIAYGAIRPLNDIDIYVPQERYKEVSELGKEYTSYGPKRLISKHWNIDYVQFVYKDTKIEVGSSEDVQIYDANKNCWSREKIDFDNFSVINVLGREVRIMKKELLIEYKKKLDREVDRVDIEQVSSA